MTIKESNLSGPERSFFKLKCDNEGTSGQVNTVGDFYKFIRGDESERESTDTNATKPLDVLGTTFKYESKNSAEAIKIMYEAVIDCIRCYKSLVLIVDSFYASTQTDYNLFLRRLRILHGSFARAAQICICLQSDGLFPKIDAKTTFRSFSFPSYIDVGFALTVNLLTIVRQCEFRPIFTPEDQDLLFRIGEFTPENIRRSTKRVFGYPKSILFPEDRIDVTLDEAEAFLHVMSFLVKSTGNAKGEPAIIVSDHFSKKLAKLSGITETEEEFARIKKILMRVYSKLIGTKDNFDIVIHELLRELEAINSDTPLQQAAAPLEDGPCEPSLFVYSGRPNIVKPHSAWKMINCIWQAKKRKVDELDLAEAIYGHDESLTGLEDIKSKANDFLRSIDYPLVISKPRNNSDYCFAVETKKRKIAKKSLVNRQS